MADLTTNNHSNPIISQVQLPGSNTIYDIHDQYAVHGPEDLEQLGLGSAFHLRGIVDTYQELHNIENPQSGDVYLVREDKTEYVCVIGEDETDLVDWYEFGGMHEHNHVATVTGTNQPSTVSGTNQSSAVTVNVPAKTYDVTTTKLSASQAAPTLSKETVLGDGTTVSVTGKGLGTVTKKGYDIELAPTTEGVIKSVTVGTAADVVSALNTTTINNPSVDNVTITQHTFADKTASKATSATPISVPQHTFQGVTASKATAVASKEASKITTEVKTPTKTSFSVANGILTIGNTDVEVNSVASKNDVTITQHTFQDVSASLESSAAAISIPQYTFADVTASMASVAASIEASKVSTSNVTVATGIKSTAKAVPSVTFDTANVLNGMDATLVESSAGDAISVVTAVAETGLTATIVPENISAVTGVTEGAITIAAGATGDVAVATEITSADTVLTGSGTAAAQTWTGTAAAQTWSGTVDVQTWGDDHQEV